MIFDIPITVAVDADTEEKAFEQLWNFLKYSKNHCGREFGIAEWEELRFIQENIDNDDEQYELFGI